MSWTSKHIVGSASDKTVQNKVFTRRKLICYPSKQNKNPVLCRFNQIINAKNFVLPFCEQCSLSTPGIPTDQQRRKWAHITDVII
jgi:hypothetical protein